MSRAKARGGRRGSGSRVARGLLLVIVAVALGFVVLSGTEEHVIAADEEAPVITARPAPLPPVTVDDGDDAAIGGDDDAVGAEGDAEAEGDDQADTTTTTTAPAGPRPPAEVTVLVANGSGLQGAAATVAATLDEAGYETAAPSNLPGGTRANASVIYHVDGFAEEAEAVAGTFTPVPPVAPMPVPPPIDDLRGASVILVLGPDLATP